MNTVQAASKSEIDLIHTLLLKKHPKIYADIWKLGVNLGLRISDLLRLKFSDFNLEERTLFLIEQKTGKKKLIRLNAAAIAILLERKQDFPDDVWLFQVRSNRARNSPISRVSVSRAFKETGDYLNLTINTHSMRKSRGMALYREGVPVEKIARVLNHSSTHSTLRYLGITQEEVLETYDQFQL